MEIYRGPAPPNTSGLADGNIVQMYVSIKNTEGVIAILMISRSRGGHKNYWNYVLEIEWGAGSPNTSRYADGHRVQMYLSITITEGVMVILMIP